jgi:hypothetical protein
MKYSGNNLCELVLFDHATVAMSMLIRTKFFPENERVHSFAPEIGGRRVATPPARPSVKPKTIHKGMRYSVFAGGKRLGRSCVWPPQKLRGKQPRLSRHAPSSVFTPIL